MRDILLMGKGYWGRHIARNLNELGRLRMIADSGPDVVAASKKEYPEVESTTDLDKALRDPGTRAVFIATPAATHAELALAAMDLGKDVFVEKPMCLTLADAQKMMAKAEATGRVLMVGHILLYHPAVVKLRDMIERGELGKIRYVYSNRLNLGKIRIEENAFWSFAPHDISVINHLLGEEPASLQAEGKAYLTEGVRDVTLSMLDYPSGVNAHIFVSWLHPYKEQRLVVVGDKQMAVFSDTEDKKLVVYPHTVEWVKRVPVPQKAEAHVVQYEEWEPLRRECETFLGCVESRQQPLTDGKNGLSVLKVLIASDESVHRKGERVFLNTKAQPSFFVHPTACVDDGARIGAGTKIWHYSHVIKGAVIGERCILGQNVNVDGGTVIGNNVKIQNNVSIYTGAVIEDDVFLGPSCVLTNVTNPRSQVKRHSLYEKTVFKRGCTVGANATIVCGVTIGRYAFVAAGSVVTRDVPDYALIMGNPARQNGWMSRHGHRLKKSGKKGVMICPESGYRYREIKNGVLKCLDLDEEASLPDALSVGTKSYEEFKSSKGKQLKS